MLLKDLLLNSINLKDFYNQNFSFNKTKDGIITVIDNNYKPIMYIVSSNRLSTLLKAESKIIKKKNKINYTKKFKMHKSWNPGKNFTKLSSLWGIYLKNSVTQEELTAFISYWEIENKLLYHVQWQQKFARSLKISRKKYSKNISTTKLVKNNQHIPYGFRG